MASLWEKIDTYLEAEFLTEMGVGGMYGTHEVGTVVVDDMLTFEKAILADDFPLILLRSLEATETFGEHGALAGNKLVVAHSYPYRVVSMVMVDGKVECRAAAQEMRRRIVTFFAKRRSLGGLRADDGELVSRVELSKTDLWLYGRNDAIDARFYGITETYINVHAKG
jgi:hypothetical protein